MKKIVLLPFILLLLSTAVVMHFASPVVSDPAKTELLMEVDLPVHNINSGKSFSTIHGAINDNETLDGHTILVDAGTYYENLVINKSLALSGENASNTIIDGMHKGDVINISADNVVVNRFTIINSKNQGGYTGVNSYNVKNCSIRDNNILNNWRGIWLYNCTNNIIHGNSILNTTESLAIWIHYSNSTVISSNTVTNNPAGVYLYYSDNNVVRRNNITDNNYYGLTLTESKGNLLIENVIANNSEWDGVALWYSSHNTVAANNILNNPHGLRFGFSSNNTIHHNNFITNAIQAYDTYREYDSKPSINSWDDGYPSGGNFWSDYTGVDVKSGPYQNETGSDGIGDTSYFIDGDNQDNYPLMRPWGDVEPPVADAGPDLIACMRGTSITFDGSESSDDVAIKSCVWTFIDITPQNLTGMQPNYTFNNAGAFEVTLNVSDYAGNWNTDMVTITVFTPDTTAPTISIISPENKTHPVEDVPLTFTVSESTFWIGYSLDGQMNVTISSNTTMIDLSDGVHTMTVYAYDTAGNMGYSDTVYFTVDTVSPNIEILSPENKTYATYSVSLSFTVNEATSWIGYSLDGLANVTITGNTTLFGLSDGSHSLIVYAKDTVGNTGTSEIVYFTIGTGKEEAFPTWIVGIVVVVVMATAIVAIFLWRRRK